jgi:hypothetical protein
MVQAIDNRAWVTGTVESLSPVTSGNDRATVTLHVEMVEDVESFPNLLGWATGSSLAVTAPRLALDATGVGVGDRLRCMVRRASPTQTIADADGMERLGGATDAGE